MVVTFINTFFRQCTLGWHFDLSPFHAFYVAIFPLRVSFIFLLIFLLQWQDLRAVFPVFKNTSKLRNSLLFVWMHARASFLVNKYVNIFLRNNFTSSTGTFWLELSLFWGFYNRTQTTSSLCFPLSLGPYCISSPVSASTSNLSLYIQPQPLHPASFSTSSLSLSLYSSLSFYIWTLHPAL